MIRIKHGLVVKITYVLNPPGELQSLEYVGYFLGTDAEEISRELCEFFREYRPEIKERVIVSEVHGISAGFLKGLSQAPKPDQKPGPEQKKPDQKPFLGTTIQQDQVPYF